jgi:hypothetical protein
LFTFKDASLFPLSQINSLLLFAPFTPAEAEAGNCEFEASLTQKAQKKTNSLYNFLP